MLVIFVKTIVIFAKIIMGLVVFCGGAVITAKVMTLLGDEDSFTLSHYFLTMFSVILVCFFIFIIFIAIMDFHILL